MWKKEKMVVSSVFSFSHNFFNMPSCSGILKTYDRLTKGKMPCSMEREPLGHSNLEERSRLRL